MQAINGVASAEILGGSTFAMRVWLDPDKMAALGITPLDVRNALGQQQLHHRRRRGEGRIHPEEHQRADFAREARSNSQQLVVATRGDTIIRLGQIASVELGPENFNFVVAFDGVKAVFMGITATPDANPLTVIAACARCRCPKCSAQLPQGLEAQHRL